MRNMETRYFDLLKFFASWMNFCRATRIEFSLVGEAYKMVVHALKNHAFLHPCFLKKDEFPL